MSGEKSTTAKSTRTKAAEKVEEKVESPVETPVIEVVEEVVPLPTPQPEVEDVDFDDEFVNFSDVEALARRGRKSKAEIEAMKVARRQGLENFYGNLIAKEPAKADMFREQLLFELKSRGLI